MKPYHIDEPKDVIELVKNIKTLPTEVMIVLGINEDDCVIYKDNITHKSKKNSATFSLRDIVKRALNENVEGVIFCHNHTEISPFPSDYDIKFTNKAKTILNQLDIHVYDHLILTRKQYFSFNDLDLINNPIDYDTLFRNFKNDIAESVITGENAVAKYVSNYN